MILIATVVKSDESLIFKRLKELNSFHRIIMTGVSEACLPICRHTSDCHGRRH